MSAFVRLEKRGAVVVLTIDRAEALNALNRAVIEDFARALDAVEGDASLRSVVVTGEGRAFVAQISAPGI